MFEKAQTKFVRIEPHKLQTHLASAVFSLKLITVDNFVDGVVEKLSLADAMMTRSRVTQNHRTQRMTAD